MMMRNTQITKMLQKARGLLILGAAFLMMCTLAPQSALADCVDPPGVLGQIIMNETSNVPAYCDNNDLWIAMSGGNPNTNTPYHANAINFNGASRLQRTATLGGGVVDGTRMTASFFVRYDGAPSGNYAILANNPSRVTIKHSGGGVDRTQFTLHGSSGIVSNHSCGPDPYIVGQWYHYLYSIDTVSGNVHCYVDDVSDIYVHTAPTGDTVNFNLSTWYVGAQNTANYMNGAIADLWIDFGTYIDFSVEANRRLFTDASNNPIYLGANGEIPTGSQPDLFFTGSAANWPTQAGAGGDFFVNGTITDDATPPVEIIDQTQIVPTGLVGHWRLDEPSGTTAFDSSGNGNDGVWISDDAPGNIKTQSGVIKNSISLDTVSAVAGDTIRVPTYFGNPPNVSFTAWVKLTPDGSTDIVSIGDNFFVRANTNNTQAIYHSASFVGITAPTSVRNDKWRHVAFVFDDTNNYQALYIDGELANSTNSTNSIVYSRGTGNTCIGSNGAGSCFNYFANGQMDDVRLYNRALDPDEIAEIYTARDGIRYNSSQRTMEYFDGNRHVSMTAQPDDVDEGPIFTYQDRNALGCPNVGNPCSDGTVYAGISPDGSMEMFTTPNDLGTYTWTDGTGTVNSSLTDCTSVPPGVQSTCQTGASNTELLATADSNSAGGLQHYEAAKACYELDTLGHDDWYLPAQDELLVLYNGRNAIGGFVQSGAFPTTYYWSSSEDTGNDSREINFDGGGVDGWQGAGGWALPVRCVRKGASAVVSGTGSKIGHWKLNEVIGTTANDETGSFNGTMLGGMTGQNNFTSGAVETAFNFDGIDDRVNMGDIFDFGTTQDFTVSAWMKAPTGAGGGIIASKRNSGVGWWIGLDASNGNLDAQFDHGSVARVIAANDYRDDTWHLITATYDRGGNLSLYVDGVLEASTDISAIATSLSTAQSFVIGSRSDGGTAFFGQIDDVRVYDYVLQPEAIAKLYLMGAPVGSSTALPQGCPSVGDVCDDGTIYVGNSADGTIPMFAAPSDEPGTYQWGSYGTLRSTGSGVDGDGNTYVLTAFGQAAHPPAYQCANKEFGGASDWYMPAHNELSIISNAGNPVAPGIQMGGVRYWSSTEFDNNSARFITMSVGGGGSLDKSSSQPIRCVRKGPAPRCANPYGLEGQMIYNTTEEVVQFCDGARWIAIGKSGSP